MTQYWEPGTQYNQGDIVLYENVKYKIIQPHRSQSDWAPSITPALWGRIQEGDCGANYGRSGDQCKSQQQCCNQSGYQDPGCQQPSYQQPSSQQQPNYQQPSYQQSQQVWQSDQKTEYHQQEERKEDHKWYDLDEDMKNKLKIGGGIAAGAGVLAAGLAAYKHHENEKEKETHSGRYEKTEHSNHSHDKLKLAGGLAAGAAVAAGGAALYKHHHEEQEKTEKHESLSANGHEGFSWDHLDESTKKKLKIGGGLAAGVGVLAAGVAVYKAHEKSKEEQETHVRQASEWLTIATKRTNEFYSRGPQGPVTWVLTHGKNIPQGAIEVSKERSWGLYICRAFLDGGIQVGKACADFPKGAVVGYQKEEHHVDTYEILLGNINQLRWVRVHGKINSSSLGRPVDGGYENNGTKLYVIKAEYPENSGVFHPGKTSENLDGAYIPYGGTEKNVKDYEVLCYA